MGAGTQSKVHSVNEVTEDKYIFNRVQYTPQSVAVCVIAKE